MSQDHRIAIVQVNAVREGVVELDEVFGRVPSSEIIEVLDSEWARELGWLCIKRGAQYQLKIAENILMEFQLGTAGEARLVMRASGTIQEDLLTTMGNQRQEELEQALVEHEAEGNLRFNEIIGRSLILALRHEARSLNYEIVSEAEEYTELTQVHDFDIKMYVHE